MVLVSEQRHPRGLDFANARRVVLLRETQHLTWDAIAKKVRSCAGRPAGRWSVRQAYRRFVKKTGATKYKYENCGRKRKVTASHEASRPPDVDNSSPWGLLHRVSHAFVPPGF